jgi:hypothetical protein
VIWLIRSETVAILLVQETSRLKLPPPRPHIDKGILDESKHYMALRQNTKVVRIMGTTK